MQRVYAGTPPLGFSPPDKLPDRRHEGRIGLREEPCTLHGCRTASTGLGLPESSELVAQDRPLPKRRDFYLTKLTVCFLYQGNTKIPSINASRAVATSKKVFDEALRCEPHRRTEYLANVCAGDSCSARLEETSGGSIKPEPGSRFNSWQRTALSVVVNRSDSYTHSRRPR